MSGSVTDRIEAVAQAIWQMYAADTGHALPAGEADRLAEAAVSALQLTEEHQWVPVQADGHRWEPRDKALAEADLALYSAGGSADYEDSVPLTHIVHESRLVGPWRKEGGQ